MADFDKAEQLFRDFYKGMVECGFAEHALKQSILRGFQGLNKEFFIRTRDIQKGTQPQSEAKQEQPVNNGFMTYAERHGITPKPKADAAPVLSPAQKKRLEPSDPKLLPPVKVAQPVKQQSDESKVEPKWAELSVDEVIEIFGGNYDMLSAQLQSMGKGKRYEPAPTEADVALQIITQAKLKA